MFFENDCADLPYCFQELPGQPFAGFGLISGFLRFISVLRKFPNTFRELLGLQKKLHRQKRRPRRGVNFGPPLGPLSDLRNTSAMAPPWATGYMDGFRFRKASGKLPESFVTVPRACPSHGDKLKVWRIKNSKLLNVHFHVF